MSKIFLVANKEKKTGKQQNTKAKSNLNKIHWHHLFISIISAKTIRRRRRSKSDF